MNPFWKREEEVERIEKDSDHKHEEEQLNDGEHPLRQTYPSSFTPEKQPKEEIVHSVTIFLSWR